MDFAVIFFILLVVTWAIKLLDKWVLKPRRVATYGAEHADEYRSKLVEYAVGFFPGDFICICSTIICGRTFSHSIGIDVTDIRKWRYDFG